MMLSLMLMFSQFLHAQTLKADGARMQKSIQVIEQLRSSSQDITEQVMPYCQTYLEDAKKLNLKFINGLKLSDLEAKQASMKFYLNKKYTVSRSLQFSSTGTCNAMTNGKANPFSILTAEWSIVPEESRPNFCFHELLCAMGYNDEKYEFTLHPYLKKMLQDGDNRLPMKQMDSPAKSPKRLNAPAGLEGGTIVGSGGDVASILFKQRLLIEAMIRTEQNPEFLELAYRCAFNLVDLNFMRSNTEILPYFPEAFFEKLQENNIVIAGNSESDSKNITVFINRAALNLSDSEYQRLLVKTLAATQKYRDQGYSCR